MSEPIAPDALRVTIEVGPDHEPTERVRAALDELVAALADADADEVSGFAAATPSLTWDGGIGASIVVSPTARKAVKGSNAEYLKVTLVNVLVSS